VRICHDQQMRLADVTTLGVGGEVLEWIEGDVVEEIIEAVTECDDLGRTCLVLGDGSNVVCGDELSELVVIHVATKGIAIERGSTSALLTVSAGEQWDAFVAHCIDEGFTGLAALSGIPGTVGASPIQNIGAYGVEVSSLISSVHVWDRVNRNYVLMSSGECQFGYRTSVFKQNIDRFVVLEVTFQLPIGSQTHIDFEQLARALDVEVGDSVSEHRIRGAVLELRASKGMVIDQRDPDSRSVGSFFINPYVCTDHSAALPADCPRYPVNADVVKLSAAWLIENAGIERGFTLGTDAHVSHKHSLALVNGGTARTADILDLARRVRAAVKQTFGVDLEPEPRLIACEL